MLTLTDPPTIPAGLDQRVTALEVAAADLVARQLRGERIGRAEVAELVEAVRAVRREL